MKWLRRWTSGIFRPHYLEIVEPGPHRLVIDSSRGEFVFDRRRRIVSRDGRALVRFDEVRFVDVARDLDPGAGVDWEVSLYLSLLHRICIGQTHDNTRASIVGARIVGVTGARALGWTRTLRVRK